MVQQTYFCSVKDIVTLCSKQHMTVQHTDRTDFNCRVNLENIKKSPNHQPIFSDFGCITGQVSWVQQALKLVHYINVVPLFKNNNMLPESSEPEDSTNINLNGFLLRLASSTSGCYQAAQAQLILISFHLFNRHRTANMLSLSDSPGYQMLRVYMQYQANTSETSLIMSGHSPWAMVRKQL